MTIGQKIKFLREEQNLTQEELGKACGTTKQTIFKYETGVVTNIPMDRLCMIAEKLRVAPSWLMGWDDPSAPVSLESKPSAFDNKEEQLISSYRQLNDEGQDKLTDYASDLVASGRYKKSSGSDLPPDLAKEA